MSSPAGANVGTQKDDASKVLPVIKDLSTRLKLASVAEADLITAVAAKCAAGSVDEMKTLLEHIRQVQSETIDPKGLRFISVLLAFILQQIAVHRNLTESKDDFDICAQVKSVAEECATRARTLAAPKIGDTRVVHSVSIAKLREVAGALNAAFGAQPSARSIPPGASLIEFKAQLSAVAARASGDDIAQLKALLTLFAKKYDEAPNKDTLLALEVLLTDLLQALAKKQTAATHGQRNDLATLADEMTAALAHRDTARKRIMEVAALAF